MNQVDNLKGLYATAAEDPESFEQVSSEISAAINNIAKNNNNVNPQSLFFGITKNAVAKNPIIAAIIKDPCKGAIFQAILSTSF